MSKGELMGHFEPLAVGKTKSLGDKKSEQNSYLPVKAQEKNVFVATPDGRLIPDIDGQRKCDYLIYCKDVPQVCFAELKGANIKNSVKNPHDQIIQTVQYFSKDSELKELTHGKVEKHAFIVSPGRQKIPKGTETMERRLWNTLRQSNKKSEIYDLVHYVKVTKSDRYSCKNGHIICSSNSPISLPFKNK